MPEALKTSYTHNLEARLLTSIFSAPHLRNQAKRFPITFFCNYQSSYQKDWSWNGATVGPSSQKWDRREKPAGEKGLHWEEVWRRCSAELALRWPLLFSVISTQLHAHTWLLPQGLPPLREARNILKSFPKFARLTDWRRLTKRTLQKLEAMTWMNPRSIQQVPIIIFP